LSNSNGKPPALEGEIVTPTQLDRILGKSEEPDVPALDAMLERFDQLLKASLKITDLDDPEGWFRELLGGMDYRIAKKTERGRALIGLGDTFIQSLDQFEQVERKVRAINRERYERHIDRIRAARTALEEQQKLEAVAANARLQRQLEEAKVQAEIREQGLRARPLPPAPPPPPPPPAPEDPRAKEKARLQADLERLAREERQEREKIAGGRPLGEWTDDMREESKRVTNMYFHAKQKVRNQLEKVL
jgi:hypothetical protein